jgi:hypothetical protein
MERSTGIENDHLRLYPLRFVDVVRRVVERVDFLEVALGFGFQVFLAEDARFDGFFFVVYVDFLAIVFLELGFFFDEEIELPDTLDLA